MRLVRAKSGICRLASLVAITAASVACHVQIAAGASTPAMPSETPVPIVELATHEDLVYARSANGRLHCWNTTTGDSKVFKQEGFVPATLGHANTRAVGKVAVTCPDGAQSPEYLCHAPVVP